MQSAVKDIQFDLVIRAQHDQAWLFSRPGITQNLVKQQLINSQSRKKDKTDKNMTIHEQ